MRIVDTISIAVAIPHRADLPERVASLARIRRALLTDEGPAAYAEFTERAPRWVWSRRLWRWAARQSVSHVLILADDTVVGPHAMRTVRAMLQAVPDKAIGLTSQSPSAPRLFRELHRWYRSSSAWTVGWAMLLPRVQTLQPFLNWRDQQSAALLEGDMGADDQLINAFLASRDEQTWHPTLTPFDHDLDMDSAMGHPIERDGRREASTKVPWTLHPWRPNDPACPTPPWSEPSYWSNTRAPIVNCPPAESEWDEWLTSEPTTSVEGRAQ